MASTDDKNTAARFFGQINDRINDSGNPQSIQMHKYELGTETYDGYKYPAVKINNEGFLNGIGASLSSGFYFSYGDSVNQGIGELFSYLKKRHAKCKNAKTRYILGGYSQGAQVIGQTLPGIDKAIRDDIVFVGLFGDPKLHYPEGEGFNPPACRGKNLSAWRRMATNCEHDSGSLGPRIPYLPDDMKTKTGLWCNYHDEICDPGQIPHAIVFGSGHLDYKKDKGIVDTAAREAIERLKNRLKADPKPTPTQPNPVPPIDYDRVLDVRRYDHEGTSGENTIFAVDASDYMQAELPGIEAFLRDAIPKVVAKGGKVSLVSYIGIKDGNGQVIDNVGVMSPFSLDPQRLIDAIPAALHPDGQNPPGSSLITLHAILSRPDWTEDATKSITLFSNSPLVDPDFVGLTTDEIAKKSLAVDPVNIYPVVPETVRASYTDLATKTSGQVVTYANATDVLQAANRAYEKISNRPVPFLKNTEYIAEVNQEVTFDASDSYILNAAITKYEWDFNGDGQFETATTTPIVNHTYTSPLTGYMQVRVTANNDMIANMSASIKIGPITPPVLPPSPTGLTYTITSTTDNKSTVTINWQADPDAHAWFIKVNDMPMGYVEPGRTTLDITDIERTNDFVISVARANVVENNKLNVSEFSNVTIPAIKTNPTPPVISTCTQSNIFLRIICQAIALCKQYIDGIWIYILPYKI